MDETLEEELDLRKVQAPKKKKKGDTLEQPPRERCGQRVLSDRMVKMAVGS